MSTNHFIYLKYVLPTRRRHQAKGLTALGKPRRRVYRMPELGDLRGRERHAAYMRRWRAGVHASACGNAAAEDSRAPL